MEHFGCKVITENNKLNRSNYAPITLATRKKGFVDTFDFRKYSVGEKGIYSTIDEAISAFFKIEGDCIVDQYMIELEEYKKRIDDVKSNDYIANGYLANYINSSHKRCIDSFVLIKCYEFRRKDLTYDESRNIADNYWMKYDNKINKVRGLENYINKSKSYCLQYCQLLIKKIIEKEYIEKIDLNEIQKELDEISLYTVEDMLESDYLKPAWMCSLITSNWPTQWKNDLLNIKLSEVRKIVLEQKFPYHIDEVCEVLQEHALYNFDLNMAFYEKLDKNNFDKEVEHFLSTNPKFVEVKNLRPYKNATGIYIMILDEYKQIYIGITNNSKIGIKGRIQHHWNATKTLDRLIFGGINNSILSIDSFKHLDTTRIFVCTGISDDLYSEEYDLVEKAFSPEFIINRTAGGQRNLVDALIMRKTRTF